MNNTVQSSDNFIIKSFRDPVSFDNELKVYSVIKGSGLAPELVSQGNNSLRLERLEAVTLSEWLKEAEDLTVLAGALADWMTAFQRLFFDKTGSFMVNDDLNPRNLLIADDRAFGIDFEFWHPGSKEEACAVLPAMIGCLDIGSADGLADHIAGMLCTKLDLDASLLGKWVRDKIDGTRLRRRAMRYIRKSSCAILAGGKGSRMGGADKSALRLGKYSFLEHLLHTVRCFDRVLLSSNDTKLTSYPCIPDIHHGLGPMGALEAVLSACGTDELMILPCDTPLIRPDSIFRMYDAFAELSEESGALVLRSGERVYPTIAIYRKTALPAVIAAIESGNYRMMRLLDSINAEYIDIKDENQFKNVNTAQDLQDLEALIKIQ
ncbi:MAG: NTP transferase domain-containing protein [Firmicutes bacterium]|nr:NTP transferase domain-containing protein [Bacillota bacterium]